MYIMCICIPVCIHRFVVCMYVSACHGWQFTALLLTSVPGINSTYIPTQLISHRPRRRQHEDTTVTSSSCCIPTVTVSLPTWSKRGLEPIRTELPSLWCWRRWGIPRNQLELFVRDHHATATDRAPTIVSRDEDIVLLHFLHFAAG